MRTIILLLLVLSAIGSYGTSITVSNNPDHPAQYTSLQEAINAVTDGDTIYVQGSNTSYGNITINKKIILIGAGPNPSTQLNLKSKLGDISLYNAGIDQNPAGTTIMGFEFGTIRLALGSGEIADITLHRNMISSICGTCGTPTVLVRNWIIQHNIIRGSVSASSVSGGWTNFTFRNNIFFNAALSNFTTSSILFDHNVFFGTIQLNYNWINIDRATFTNNIFYWTGAGTLLGASANYCVFNNNLAYLPAIGHPGDHSPTNDFVNTVDSGGGNTGGGNLIEVSPEFTSVPSFSFNDTFDFRLKDESLAKNAGTDGTDLGIYGGSNPWPDYSGAKSNPHPPIPQLTNVDVQNSTVPANGTLTIKVKAKSQN